LIKLPCNTKVPTRRKVVKSGAPLTSRCLYGGEKRLPRFQFERAQVIPGLREVLAAFPQGLNPLDVAEWFLSSNPDLEIVEQEQPLSPREWLLKGHSAVAVVNLAQGFR
jgi:hypothetical protein